MSSAKWRQVCLGLNMLINGDVLWQSIAYGHAMIDIHNKPVWGINLDTNYIKILFLDVDLQDDKIYWNIFIKYKIESTFIHELLPGNIGTILLK